jgi:hypothetical protein
VQGITLIKANPSFIEIATGSGTVVVHLPHHPKVNGLSPVATTAYTGREKIRAKVLQHLLKILELVSNRIFYQVVMSSQHQSHSHSLIDISGSFNKISCFRFDPSNMVHRLVFHKY